MAKNKRKRKSDGLQESQAFTNGKPKGKNPLQNELIPNNQSKPPLAQLLKKHRGVAASTPPPPIWKGETNRLQSFLTPQDDPQAFKDCLKTSFSGFRYDYADALPSCLHRNFDSSFDGMDKGGLFLYDVVQPGKKRLTRTSVTRTLVGDPGSTYKYLGLRLFSHPWFDVDEDGNSIPKSQSNETHGFTLRKLGYPNKTASALILMGVINSNLIEKSELMLQKHMSPHVQPVGLVGSAQFNLTLVNKMETAKGLKRETEYGMGKVSVGWHRDSGLKDFSTITVYQSLKEVYPSKNSDSWCIALRAMEGGAGGPIPHVPPLLIPLPSGSMYYMLDDFNHNHEHAVIAGSGGTRFSSTHRVAREGQGTWQYIRDKIKFSTSMSDIFTANQDSDSTIWPKKKFEKVVSTVRAQQNLMNEIEFEWLRQWFVQGQKHAGLHPYWHNPIRFLCVSFCKIEHATSQVLDLLSNVGANRAFITEDLYDILIEALTERSKLRAFWKEKYQDPIFDVIPEMERPFSCPCLDRVTHEKGQMPEDLDALVSKLRRWRSSFVSVKQSDSGVMVAPAPVAKRLKKSKPGLLTRRESKQKASNWERLKSNMTK